MAAHARAEVTLVDQTDADALVTWYRLATSATRPSKPTTTAASATPSGWAKTEPAYSGGSTSYLYTCLQLVWGDGTCDWGEVQLSSSYEAAKAAWNKAQAAADAAAATANYFWHDSGGAHVSTVAGSTATGDSATLASGALSFASGGTVQASFAAALVRLLAGAVRIAAGEGTWLVPDGLSPMVDVPCLDFLLGSDTASALSLYEGGGASTNDLTVWGTLRAASSILLGTLSDPTGTISANDALSLGANAEHGTVSLRGGRVEVDTSSSQLDGAGLWHNGQEVATRPVELYSSAAGTRGTVALSEGAGGFSRIDIVYGTDVNANGVVYRTESLSSPDGRSVALEVTNLATNSTTWQTAVRTYRVSGTSVTPGSGEYYRNFGGSTSQGDAGSAGHIRIYEVWGHR